MKVILRKSVVLVVLFALVIGRLSNQLLLVHANENAIIANTSEFEAKEQVNYVFDTFNKIDFLSGTEIAIMYKDVSLSELEEVYTFKDIDEEMYYLFKTTNRILIYNWNQELVGEGSFSMDMNSTNYVEQMDESISNYSANPYDYWSGYGMVRRGSLTINWYTATTLSILAGLIAGWIGVGWGVVITYATDFVISTYNNRYVGVYGIWEHSQNTTCYLLVKEKFTMYNSSAYSTIIGTSKILTKWISTRPSAYDYTVPVNCRGGILNYY